MTLPNLPPEWERWRGGVDTTLKGISKKQTVMEKKLDEMPDEIEKRLELVINGPKAAERCPYLANKTKAPIENPNGQAVTFKWLLEKALLPFLLSLSMVGVGILLARGA
jgi:hypothetical protein